MSGIPNLNPIGPGQLSVPSSFPNQLPLSRHFDLGPQYGVSDLSGLVSSMMPGIGALIGGGMNMLNTALQNRQQEKFYEEYMSPKARMQQMMAAGINPNAAAQGISGSSAPQMNAAAPTSAFTGIGEQLGNSVNTALTAQNIAAQTRNLEVQSEGQDLMNKMTEVELGMKPDVLTVEMEEKKAHADEMRQTVTNLKKELDKYDQEIKNLKAQELLIIAQEGQVAFDNYLKEAQTKKAQAEEALAKANKELADANKAFQEKENENYLTPEERITKTAEANEAAKVKNDPVLRSKEELTKQFEKENAELQSQIDSIEKELNAYSRGWKKDNYFGTNRSNLEYQLKSLKNKQKNLRDQYYENIRRYNSNESISIGLHGVSRGK